MKKYLKKLDYKTLIIIGSVIALESMLYFLAKLSPLKSHVVNIALDNKIPFKAYFIYFYVSWYLSLVIVPYIFRIFDKKVFLKYIVSSLLGIIIGFLIFVFFPSTMERDELVVEGVASFLTKLIYLADTPIKNCLPSMHCLLSFLFIYGVIDCRGIKKRYKVLITIWSLFIVLSTLFIKQHVILDALSAFIISLGIYLVISIPKIDNFFNKKLNFMIK